jgi:hypothetical protein
MRRGLLRAIAPVFLFFIAGPAAARDAGAGVDRVLPFVQDDYARALAEARAQRLPLFVEAWAPW